MPYRTSWLCLALLGFCLGNPVTCCAYEPVTNWVPTNGAGQGAQRYRLERAPPFDPGRAPANQPYNPPTRPSVFPGDPGKVNVSPRFPINDPSPKPRVQIPKLPSNALRRILPWLPLLPALYYYLWPETPAAPQPGPTNNNLTVPQLYGPQPAECANFEGLGGTGCLEVTHVTCSEYEAGGPGMKWISCGTVVSPAGGTAQCTSQKCALVPIGTPDFHPPIFDVGPDGLLTPRIMPPLEWEPPSDLPWPEEAKPYQYPIPDEEWPDPIPEIDLPAPHELPGTTTTPLPDGGKQEDGLRREWTQPDPLNDPDAVDVKDIPFRRTTPAPQLGPNGEPIPGTPTVVDGPAQSPTATPAPTPAELPDQCRDHPETLGCAGAGVVPDTPVLPTRDLDVSFNPSSSNSSCPSPETFTALGRTYSLSYNYLCDFAVMIKPIVVAVALIAALAIILM